MICRSTYVSVPERFRSFKIYRKDNFRKGTTLTMGAASAQKYVTVSNLIKSRKVSGNG